VLVNLQGLVTVSRHAETNTGARKIRVHLLKYGGASRFERWRRQLSFPGRYKHGISSKGDDGPESSAEQLRESLAQEVREGTGRFRDINVAFREGYAAATTCVSGPDTGAMGAVVLPHLILLPVAS
jgi:hypothetical protein